MAARAGNDAVVVPQPVVVAVLPEYKPTATLATQRDMVDRTLFNPTRRPAPVAAAEAGKKRLQPGQFVLTGTLIVDGKATAFLRESAGGKSRRVAQGEQINGMLVADVKPDRVKLTLGGESEDLVLKVAIGPKSTIQPGPPLPGAPVMPGAGGGCGARHRTDQRRHAGRTPSRAAGGCGRGGRRRATAAECPAGGRVAASWRGCSCQRRRATRAGASPTRASAHESRAEQIETNAASMIHHLRLSTGDRPRGAAKP